MSSRTSRTNQPPPPASNRQNEYFVPRDGIDREVITADICRYLGNDALVRPGVYESPQSGQVVQGYYITAYRNLTTAMIEDLKADSARWDQERRQQTARNPVGVQYRNSDTHQSRQYYGPTEGTYQSDSRDQFETPRYPGSGNAGYTGASGGFAGQNYSAQPGYGGQPYQAAQTQPQFSPTPSDPSYQAGTMATPGYGAAVPDPRPYQAVNSNFASRQQPDNGMYATNEFSATSRDRVTVSTLPQARQTTYVTSGPPQTQGFPSTAASGSYYPGQGNAPVPTTQFAAQPQDPFYGRGNPAYSATHDSQYETNPTPRSSAPSSSTQMATSGSSSRHTRDSVERERHTDTRHRSHRSRQ